MNTLRHKAIQLLARREHSAWELTQKLSVQANASELAALLQSLRDQDLQSDLRFVQSYLRSRQNAGYGPIRIRQELRQRGVSQALVDEQVMTEDTIWWQLLQQVWQKKYCGVPPSDAKSYGQQQRFLLQRGFAMQDVIKLLKFGD